MITLIAGIVFFLTGIAMIAFGVQAEGTIDLKSTFASGSIKTGSAGLLITFLAFFIILTAVLVSAGEKKSEQAIDQPQSRTALYLFIFLLLVSVSLGVGGALLGENGRPLIAGAAGCGFFAFVCLMVVLGSIAEQLDRKSAERRFKQRPLR